MKNYFISYAILFVQLVEVILAIVTFKLYTPILHVMLSFKYDAKVHLALQELDQ